MEGNCRAGRGGGEEWRKEGTETERGTEAGRP